jgi:hypothetical protein
VISLIFGLIFAGFTVVWLLIMADVIDHGQAWVIGPVVLMAAGATGLVAALRPRPQPDEPEINQPREF